MSEKSSGAALAFLAATSASYLAATPASSRPRSRSSGFNAMSVPSLAAAAAARCSSLLPGTKPTLSLGTTYVCALPMMSVPATPASFVCKTW